VFRHFGRTDGYAAGGAGGDDTCAGLAGAELDGCTGLAGLEPDGEDGARVDCSGLTGALEPASTDGAEDDSTGIAGPEPEEDDGAADGAGEEEPMACGTADVELAMHFVQIVEVEVMSTVDTVWVVKTASLVPDVTVVVIGQVVTEVMTL